MGVYSGLETFARECGWVVKYSGDGTPSLFARIGKCKSSDLDASLPERVHPAFIVNGEEISERLIAIYEAGDAPGGEQSASMPNLVPTSGLGADALLARIKQSGSNFGPKTCADSGLLLLLARKHGYAPKGNTNYGADSADGTLWALGDTIALGAARCFRGAVYTALAAHTATAANRPDVSALHWKYERRAGGLPCPGLITAEQPSGETVLTGTGPETWRLDGTYAGIDNLCGNCAEVDYGYRVVSGEIQILTGNNAADPSADLSAASAAWKAILPNADDDGHTLVAPGTTGTLKWTNVSGVLTLDTAAPTLDGTTVKTAFASLGANAVSVPHVPAILIELGLFPIAGDDAAGSVTVKFSAGEFLARRGGNYLDGGDAGLGGEDCAHARAAETARSGARSAYIEP